MSRVSAFKPGAPIRGGVPLVFPQFGGGGPLPLHGIVRINSWEHVGAEVAGGRATATFRLQDSEATRALWPQAFRTGLAVTVGGNELTIELAAENTGDAPFTFTNSLHTYLAVQDLAATCVEGLAGLRYRDAAAGGIEKVEEEPRVDFRGEVNRIYFDAPAEVRLVHGDRTLVEPGRGLCRCRGVEPGRREVRDDG